jgi:hypothetical protein
VQDIHDIKKDGLTQNNPITFQCIKDNGGTCLKEQKTELCEAPLVSTMEDSHVTHSYHPHTVAFDSPGCRDMLIQMASMFDVRLDFRLINLQHLDITTYLSAPNLINTCNSHIGTVYRLYIDLSDMGLLERHTAFYNLATHNIDKIKQAFDPENGQVRKDNKGELKIREVVDWPVSAGLKYGAEMNEFFEFVNYFNNYHLELQDSVHEKMSKGYHGLRYQTKTYDECTNSLSVFTEDEREFLERYRWLRDLSDVFRPEDLFYVMNNVAAQNVSKQMLRNFELENYRIRCPDAGTLRELIPFVKRLARLYPQIKEKAKVQLLPVII